MFLEKENSLFIQHGPQKTLIMAWGENSFRVRSYEQAQMPSEDWALITPIKVETKIVIEDDYATITNGKIKASVSKSGKITFYNDKGEILLEEFERNRDDFGIEPGTTATGFASALEIKGRNLAPILSADYHLICSFESNVNEKLYGMGQYQQAFLDIKGCEFELAQRNSQASVPFIISSLNYGFLWNNPAIGRANFAKNITTWEAFATKGLDYYITAGDNPREIQEAYGKATGVSPMMPEYAMGFWQCKLRYQTQDELLEVAREYKRRNLPISVIVVDFFHWTMQGEWEFDKKYWPDPEAMVKELKEMNIELMVSIWPTVDHRSKYYDEMKEKGLLITTDRGHKTSMNFHGNTIHYDATNPEAQKYVWEKSKQNYYDKGIKTFWLDEAEPEYTYYDFDLYRYHLGSNSQIGNIYPFMYAKTFYDGMKAEGQENIINLLRCAWAGSQRFGALVWSGDIDSSFRSLRSQFTAGLNMGIAGIPWWTTDIGGFHGGNINDNDFKEVLIRWFEYGTFCPVMRLHGVREPQFEALDLIGTTGGGVCNSGAPNEVWSYGEDNLAIFSKYLNMRENMKPYITKLMKETSELNTPVIRPLFFDFPDDKNAWNIEDSYMFGADVLVSPIMHAKKFTKEVYFPKGADWTNIWTNEVYKGGTNATINAPIEIIPVFTRVGSDVVIL